MKELSLFTGSGGGIYGTKLLGFTTIGYVEFDNYCQSVIAQRIKDGIFDCAPIFGDIRTFAVEYASSYRGLVDIVTAGFPCQPFSIAGKRKGSDDERNMWPATFEVIQAVRPKWAFLENVPGLLGKHRYFETILKDLSEAGYDVRWICLSAAEVGAPHKRERLWVLATNTFGQQLRQQSGWGEEECLADAEGCGLQRLCSQGGRSEGEGSRVQSKPSGISSREVEWWTTEPNVGRVADGVANRKYRLKTLGNGQVPSVVREAWKYLNANT